MQRPRRPTREEPKVPARGDGDINRERLIFCVTSLVGQKVHCEVRNNVTYEGLFHSCLLDGDFSITLKYARQLPSGARKSGKVIPTLIIPGKDFLQVSALDVPNPSNNDTNANASGGQSGFATDGAIAEKTAGSAGYERELVPWTGDGGGDQALGGLEDDMKRGRNEGASWDQFAANEHMYGITTTYDDSKYTTKLDPNSIPLDKRREADRIAKEIEASSRGDLDNGASLDNEDEELKFSAVGGTGAYRSGAASKPKGDKSEDAAAAGEAKEEELQLKPPAPGAYRPPGARARDGGGGELKPKSAQQQAEKTEKTEKAEKTEKTDKAESDGAAKTDAAAAGDSKGSAAGDTAPKQTERQKVMSKPLPQVPFNRELMGMGPNDSLSQTLESRNKSSALRLEMKRINALNLEPALPKLDTEKTRNDGIRQVMDPPKPLGEGFDRGAFRRGSNQSTTSEQSDALVVKQPSKDTPSGKSKALNPQAKEFSFNSQAAAFTPVGASQGNTFPAQSGTKPATPANQPAFKMGEKTPLTAKGLSEILDSCYERARKDRSDGHDNWTEAQGPTYKSVLGQPNMAVNQMQGQMAPGPGGCWQQGHGQGCQSGMGCGGGGPQGGPQGPQGMMGMGGCGQTAGTAAGNVGQNMQPGFMVPTPGGGNQNQMYPQVFMMPQGPGMGGGQQRMNGCGGPQQQGFVMANMGGGGQCQQGQQPVVFFNQSGQMMMMPQGMQPGGNMQGNMQGGGMQGGMQGSMQGGMQGNMQQGGRNQNDGMGGGMGGGQGGQMNKFGGQMSQHQGGW